MNVLVFIHKQKIFQSKYTSLENDLFPMFPLEEHVKGTST